MERRQEAEHFLPAIKVPLSIDRIFPSASAFLCRKKDLEKRGRTIVLDRLRRIASR